MYITFAKPIYLWFLLTIPILFLTHFITLKHSKIKALKFANFDAIARVLEGHKLTKPFFGFKNKDLPLMIIRIFILLFITLALSGTILWYEGQSSTFDFVLAIDASSSMLADDFTPNRFDAAKRAASLFVDSLTGDADIGIISFAGASFVDLKPTNDILAVKQTIIDVSIKPASGTDLGQAMITSTNLLSREKRAKSIILLTDGQDNVGIPVQEGIDYANKYGLSVNTIGMGTEKGGKLYGLNFTTTLDESMLQKIALNTGGKYYRAKNESSLMQAYKEIATSNKEKLSLNLSWIFMLIAFLTLFLEWGLTNTRYRTIP